MLAKIYWFTWLAIALATALILATGNMSVFWIVVFGFIAFGMVFMGMMNVLPDSISHPAPKVKAAEPKRLAKPATRASIESNARSVRV